MRSLTPAVQSEQKTKDEKRRRLLLLAGMLLVAINLRTALASVLSAATAGWLLALSQATGIAGSAVVPFRAARFAEQKRTVLALGVLEAMSLLGLLLASAAWVSSLAVAGLGFAMGGTFSLALLFLVLRAHDTHMATSLSGMAQSIGYMVAAIGPALIGFIRDLSGGWTVPLLCLFGVLAAKVAAGIGAGRDRVVAG